MSGFGAIGSLAKAFMVAAASLSEAEMPLLASLAMATTALLGNQILALVVGIAVSMCAKEILRRAEAGDNAPSAPALAPALVPVRAI